MTDSRDISAPDGARDDVPDDGIAADDRSDAALLRRLFDLTCGSRGDRNELQRIESQVYAKLIEAYDAPEPPSPGGYGRAAA